VKEITPKLENWLPVRAVHSVQRHGHQNFRCKNLSAGRSGLCYCQRIRSAIIFEVLEGKKIGTHFIAGQTSSVFNLFI